MFQGGRRNEKIKVTNYLPLPPETAAQMAAAFARLFIDIEHSQRP